MKVKDLTLGTIDANDVSIGFPVDHEVTTIERD